MKKKINYYLSIFGATGVIGSLTFDIIESLKNINFKFFLFTANENLEKMISLILKYNPMYVYMFKEELNYELEKILNRITGEKKGNVSINNNFKRKLNNKNNNINENYYNNNKKNNNNYNNNNYYNNNNNNKYINDVISTKIIKNKDQLIKLFKKDENHVFINGIMGYNGLIPTLIAQKYNYKLGIANKESIIILGEIQKNIKNVYPLDSEHFALFKLLKTVKKEQIKNLIITSSGGKVHGKSLEKIKKMKIEDILQHPTWSMGNKITIDSSTGMNKAFEVLEAHYLFKFPIEKIKVYINPKSTIHGIILTKDNTYYTQASIPDMHLSIYNFFKDVLNVEPGFKFKNINFNDLNFILKKVQFTKFKVLKYLYENYNKVSNIGTKYIILNDIILEKMMAKDIDFYQYNKVFFKIFKKIKSYKLDFSLDEKLIILTLERFRNYVELCFNNSI